MTRSDLIEDLHDGLRRSRSRGVKSRYHALRGWLHATMQHDLGDDPEAAAMLREALDGSRRYKELVSQVEAVVRRLGGSSRG